MVENKRKYVSSGLEDVQEGQIQEVTALVTVPPDGGWGWVVVACSFLSIFVLDGVAYTFGSIILDMAKDLKKTESSVALINSTAVALYFTASPVASALINKHGFRTCTMSGSVICSMSLLCSYFAGKYPAVFIFYGVTAGFGFSLINMSSSLIVGFYFEKLRSVALAISTCGASLGVMTLFPTNAFLVKLCGWRTTTLLHSGLLGLIFFLGMAYRPLLSFTVKNDDDNASTCTLVHLPNLVASTASKHRKHQSRTSVNSNTKKLESTTGERFFGAVSNIHFPTASKIVMEKQSVTLSAQPDAASSTKSKSKLILTPNTADGTLTETQLQRVKSIITSRSEASVTLKIDNQQKAHPPKQQSFWQRFFNWEQHHKGSARPLYRDDAFYEGKLEDLPIYQKSVSNIKPEERTGFEYQLAVTRTTEVRDLKERTELFGTSFKRVLATMLDLSLLQKSSFLLLCASGFFIYLGFLVPYVYLLDRNLREGVDPNHCRFFISAISFSNACGRLVLGFLASKLDPISLFAFFCTLAGLSTVVSGLSYNLYYQYGYCVVFGFSISCVASLRSLILVQLYGLPKLTNATGMMLIFLGIGNLISTPLAAWLKKKFGYAVVFYVAGGFITTSGLILVIVRICSKKEIKKSQKNESKSTSRETPQFSRVLRPHRLQTKGIHIKS